MSKNFLNFLTTSVIILSCGTVINNSSCYCIENKMESKKESTMDETNNISTNISQQDDSFNTINETRPNHNLQIHNIPVQNTFDSKELIATTDNLFTNSWYFNKKSNYLNQEIKNYLNNIKEFYQSNDINTLKELTKLVKTAHDIVFPAHQTNLFYNINQMKSKNIITSNEAEEILAFNLLLYIIMDIESYNALVFTNDAIRDTGPNKSEILNYQLIKDNGKKVWVNTHYKDWIKVDYNRKQLWTGIEETIKSITTLLIPKYFILDNLEIWLTRDELTSEIKDYIQSMCKYFDSLPLIKQILNSKNIKSIYDRIPKVIMDESIYYAINNFVYKQSVKNELKQKSDAYIQRYQELQRNRAMEDFNVKEHKIKSKYIKENIFSYVNTKDLNKISQYKKVLSGMPVSGTIQNIANSYLIRNQPLDEYYRNIKDNLFIIY